MKKNVSGSAPAAALKPSCRSDPTVVIPAKPSPVVKRLSPEQLLLALNPHGWDKNLYGPAPAPHPDVAPLLPNAIAVIDVRGSDRPKYGHIEGSLNIPCGEINEQRLVALCQFAASNQKQALVFHCLHSKHRAVYTVTMLARIMEVHPSGPYYKVTDASEAQKATKWPLVCLLSGGFKAWLERWALPAPHLCHETPETMLRTILGARFPWRKKAPQPAKKPAAVKEPPVVDVSPAATSS